MFHVVVSKLPNGLLQVWGPFADKATAQAWLNEECDPRTPKEWVNEVRACLGTDIPRFTAHRRSRL